MHGLSISCISDSLFNNIAFPIYEMEWSIVLQVELSRSLAALWAVEVTAHRALAYSMWKAVSNPLLLLPLTFRHSLLCEKRVVFNRLSEVSANLQPLTLKPIAYTRTTRLWRLSQLHATGLWLKQRLHRQFDYDATTATTFAIRTWPPISRR